MRTRSILMRSGALPTERIMGVETGGCPHTAIREDASINLAAVVRDARSKFPEARNRDPHRIGRGQSGGDLLARTGGPHDLRDRRRGGREDPVARAAPASPGRTCWSSTRPTSRRSSVPTSAIWTAIPGGCGGSAPSSSPTSRRATGSPRSPVSSRRRAACRAGKPKGSCRVPPLSLKRFKGHDPRQ